MRFSQYFVPLGMVLSGADALTINSDSCLKDITTTVTQDGTKTVTEQTTKTITTTAQNVNPPFKKRAANVPVIPSYASSACSDSAKYSSACSRVGVTSKTITLPRTTIVSVIHNVIIPRRTTIKTAIATAYATKTVKTEVVQETYSTEKISKVVGTQTKDNIIATETKTEISTKTEASDPLQTIYLIAHDSGDPNLAPLGGVGFTDLENQIGSGKYFLDFTADVSSTLTFTLNQRTGELKPVNGPGSSTGTSAYYNTNGNSNNYVRFMSTEEATLNDANSLVCKIVPATEYPLGLQCLWGTNQIAAFWTCCSRLVVVQPGVDFTTLCAGASTSYNINVEVRWA